MRLIDTTTFEFLEFEGNDIPEYAILSHRWTSPQEEVSYREYKKGLKQQSAGYRKIQNFCRHAREEGFRYAWVDTCCIDKKSSAELAEAINSMFMWYGDAMKCYAYLDDVHGADDWKTSQWWKRGWTLSVNLHAELIAPETVEFYNKYWLRIGSKGEFASAIQTLTSIPRSVLIRPGYYRSWSVAQKMSWASGRQTTRIEDRAYSLMGLFSINMPLLYGEGARAFERLQLEIIRKFLDESIFAWTARDAFPQSVLASSPDDFSSCAKMSPNEETELKTYIRHPNRSAPSQVTNWGIELTAAVLELRLFTASIEMGKYVTRLLVLRLAAAWSGEIRSLPCTLVLCPSGPGPGMYRRLRCIHGTHIEVLDMLKTLGHLEESPTSRKIFLQYDRDFHRQASWLQ